MYPTCKGSISKDEQYPLKLMIERYMNRGMVDQSRRPDSSITWTVRSLALFQSCVDYSVQMTVVASLVAMCRKSLLRKRDSAKRIRFLHFKFTSMLIYSVHFLSAVLSQTRKLQSMVPPFLLAEFEAFSTFPRISFRLRSSIEIIRKFHEISSC